MIELTSKETIPQTPESTSATLLEYESQGYLFHGSASGTIEELEPRKANDVDPRRIFNNDTAVFATKSALGAVIFGCVPSRAELPEDIRSLVWSTSWKDGKVISQIPTSWKDYVEKFHGYIYILPSENFTENNGSQYKSKVAVNPIDKIQVNLEVFLQMGGKVEWV